MLIALQILRGFRGVNRSEAAQRELALSGRSTSAHGLPHVLHRVVEKSARTAQRCLCSSKLHLSYRPFRQDVPVHRRHFCLSELSQLVERTARDPEAHAYELENEQTYGRHLVQRFRAMPRRIE